MRWLNSIVQSGSLAKRRKRLNPFPTLLAALAASVVLGAQPAQSSECKKVYRVVEFCPEALRGVGTIASDEKNFLAISIGAERFKLSTSFFDHEEKRDADLFVVKALFNLMYVKNAIPDAEIVSETKKSLDGFESVTFRKQNKTWNRKTVGYTTSVSDGENILVVNSFRSASEFTSLDQKVHEMTLSAFRIKGDG